MRKSKASRYRQLSDGQRAILGEADGKVSVAGQLKSFTGRRENLKHFEAALLDFKKIVVAWPTGPAWIHAFIRRCDSQSLKSKRGYETICGQFKNGFAKFLEQKSLTQLEFSDYSTQLVIDFRAWLRIDSTKKAGSATGDGKPRSGATSRKYFQQFQLLIDELRQDSRYGKQLPAIVFPNIPFSGSAANQKRYEILDDLSYKNIYLGCRQLAEATSACVWYAQSIFASESVKPDDTRRGRGKYGDLASLLSALNHRYPGVLPNQATIRRDEKVLCDAIQYIHGGYRAIQEYFQPSAETLLPFIILLAIYTQANTGPLRSLRVSNIQQVEVLGRQRIQLQFEKGRGQYSYKRSYALDEADPLSPDGIRRTIEQWTRRIRGEAEAEAKANFFIFVSQQGRVRSFLTAVDYGSDSDSSWKNAIKNLCKLLGIEGLTTSQLRFTGLDIVREITNDDIRAVKAAGGQKAESTIKLHYEGAGAARRRHEALAEVMQTQERWVDTRGRANPRGAPDHVNISAATPGWGCIDPYCSPIPGQAHGRLCGAFGSCPACPHATLDCRSSYALARVLQLNDEVQQAMDYLDAPRWFSTYGQVAIALRNKWIPSFSDPRTWEEASQLNLGPIGRLE